MSSEEEAAPPAVLLINGVKSAVDCADIAPGHNGRAVRRRGDHGGGIYETALCNIYRFLSPEAEFVVDKLSASKSSALVPTKGPAQSGAPLLVRLSMPPPPPSVVSMKSEWFLCFAASISRTKDWRRRRQTGGPLRRRRREQKAQEQSFTGLKVLIGSKVPGLLCFKTSAFRVSPSMWYRADGATRKRKFSGACSLNF